MTDRRPDAGFLFQPCDRVREVQAAGDLDQLQKIPFQSTLEAVEALRMDGQVRRLPPVSLAGRTEETAALLPKAQGDSDPARISGFL